MNNTKHTPGPWMMVRTLSHPFAVIAGTDPKGKQVAAVQSAGATIMPQEREANARLIAAAPEILDTLQAILEWTESRDGDARTDENIVGSIGQMARAAIAKATGQQ